MVMLVMIMILTHFAKSLENDVDDHDGVGDVGDDIDLLCQIP